MAIAGRDVSGGFSAQNFLTHYTRVGIAMTQAFAQNPLMAAAREAEIRETVEK
jgi:hypothetical protein